MAQALKLSKSAFLSIALGVDALLLDRGHKFFQINIQGWSGGEYVPVTGFLDYMLVWNRGVSYGFLDGVPQAFILLLIGMAMAALVWWWVKAETQWIRIGLALCLGGAVSNAIDRGLYGAVADFFHLHIGTWSFYVFNIADAAISIGAGLLVLDLLFSRRDAIA